MSEPFVRSSLELEWEGWSADQLKVRGHVVWKTLLSGGLTPSDSLTGGLARVPPGEQLVPHHHEPAELYFMLKGTAAMTLGDSVRTVSAGDLVFIPGNVRHGIANPSQSDVEFFYCFARDSFDEIVYHFPNED